MYRWFIVAQDVVTGLTQILVYRDEAEFALALDAIELDEDMGVLEVERVTIH